MNVYTKLQNCRVELQKKNVKKSGQNKFAGFNYYELADFIPVVNEMFAQNGLTSVFSIIDNTASLTIINCEKPEENVVFTSPIADANIKGCTPVQSLGGVHTYLKRYLYLNALEIVECDMLDSKVGDMQPDDTDYRQKLIDFLKANNADMNEIAKAYKLNSKSTQEDYKRVLKDLEV